MKPSIVLERIRHSQTAFGTALQLIDGAIFEMTALMGFDAIWLDLEHHSPSDQQAQELIRAARAGGPTDVVVRPGKGEFARMARLLESGARGVMYPRCESAAEAAEVVRWGKFAPIGERGFDGAGADGEYLSHPMTKYLEHANASTFIIAQVEDERALASSDEIIRVPGIDMLMLGPADLTVLTGNPGQFRHPTILEAQQRVASSARAVGKHWASTAASIEHAAELKDLGASLIFHGADILFVRRGLATVKEAFDRITSAGIVRKDGHLASEVGASCAGR
jgi:4-hydroxy-2-oxoheptanedioate aldolase